MPIHPTAIVSTSSQIADDAEIGPYAVVESDVTIGRRTKILTRANICQYTQIGDDCEVHMGAVLGHYPQDLSFKKKRSWLKIGDRNIIREYVTMHRGTQEDSSTLIGNDNFFMAFAHVGHNCRLGNNIVIANAATLGGYVEVEDRAFISGRVVVHQFTRIGALAMLGGQARVVQDVPPYMLVKGENVYSPNFVGLRRAGFSIEARNNIKKAYKILYRSGHSLSRAVGEIERSGLGSEVQYLVDFLKKDSKRGIIAHI